MAEAPLVDQQFLEKLERLTLHWQKSFRGIIGGRIPSRLSGPGQEFLDHRHFHHGDDLRAVNWRAYLRLEKLFLKLFQVEPRIPVRLLIDRSESMETKFDYVRRLVAAVCYIGLVRLDTICLQPFAGVLDDTFTTSGGRHRFMPTVQFLQGLEHGGATDYMTVARQFVGKYPQRGLVIAVSDFLDNSDVRKPLQYISDFGHELLLVQVWAPEDREPPWDGEVELVDAETEDVLEMALDAEARAQYTVAFDAHCRAVQEVANRSGGRYVGLSTETPLEDALFGSLMTVGGIQ
jgi:uncharacterized protein (DUF58 family)